MNRKAFRRSLRAEARKTMLTERRALLPIVSTLLLLALVTLLLELTFGGLMTMLMLDTTKTSIETGIFAAQPDLMTGLLALAGRGTAGTAGGLILALRFESLPNAIVLLLPWMAFLPYLGVLAASLLLTAPLFMGTITFLRALHAQEKPNPQQALTWYTKPPLLARSLGIGFVLALTRMAASLCALPSLWCILLSARSSDANNASIYMLLSLLLLLIGMCVQYFLTSLLLPARYILAQNSSCTVPRALREGWALMAGRRANFFRLRLSFLPLHLLSTLLMGMADAVIFPYEELSSLLFLQAQDAEVASPTPTEERI